MAERVLAVLAGVLSVIAGVLGIWAARATADLDEAEATVDSVVDERERLSGELARADERVEELESAATSSTTTTQDATTTTEIVPGAAGVFRETGAAPVTFAEGYGIDLDTRDPNWSVSTIGGDIQLNTHRDGLSLYIASRTIALVDGEPSYAQCEAQTVLQEAFSAELTVVGQTMCIRTTEDRWAFVEIVGLDPGRETVTLRIVVWTLEAD